MNVIQLIYVSSDDSRLHTRWRTPGGTWTEPNSLFGNPQSKPAAALVPGTETLQLFYRGTDNSIYTRWRDSNGIWSDEEQIGGTLNGDPITAQIPDSQTLQLFYRGTNNAIYTRWRNSDGTWSSESKIGGTANGDPIAAQIPGTKTLQLFYRGASNAIYTLWRDPNGTWSSESKIGGTLNGDPIAAQIPDSQTLQLFYRGTNDAIYTRWRNSDGTWSTENKIGGTANGDPIAAQIPGTKTLQLFYRGASNAMYTLWRNSDGTWSGESKIGGTVIGDPVAVQIPDSQVLQLFYRGASNAISTLWRNSDGTWSSENEIGGPINSDPVAVTVVAAPELPYTVVLMLWGPLQIPGQSKWQTAVTGKEFGNALKTIAGSTYFSDLAQYGVKEVSIFSADPPQLSAPALPPGNDKFTTLFTVSGDIANVVRTSFSAGIPTPDHFTDSTPIYIVVTPRGGFATDAPGSMGEHLTGVWGPNNKIFIYAYSGVQEDLNNSLNVATHEICEALGQNGGAPKELCDGCKEKYGGGVSTGIDGYTAASYFDASTNQCVAPPNFAEPA